MNKALESEVKELRSFIYWIGCYRSYGAVNGVKKMLEQIDNYYSAHNDANGFRPPEEVDDNIEKAYRELLKWADKMKEDNT